jgi:hypothetical protein
MYHSITQVLYFHFPDYSRKRQISLEELRKGKPVLHCLSVALQLVPDVEVCLEDETWWKGKYSWVVMPGGKVYLAGPSGGLWTGASVWDMVAGMNGSDAAEI